MEIQEVKLHYIYIERNLDLYKGEDGPVMGLGEATSLSSTSLFLQGLTARHICGDHESAQIGIALGSSPSLYPQLDSPRNDDSGQRVCSSTVWLSQDSLAPSPSLASIPSRS